jgi:hypothetical protein
MQLFVLLLLFLLFVLLLLIACINYCFNSVLFLLVVPDEELMDPSEKSVEEPSGDRTPPTQPAGGSSYNHANVPWHSFDDFWASIFPLCQQTEATLMCMEPSRMMRYGSLFITPFNDI